MTIGSLFSGIGGLELGLEWAGLGPTLWQVEMDPFCRGVLAMHWPKADRTVKDVNDAERAALAGVDIICGGFPCQDISFAGKGAGLDGKRSGLWFAMLRTIKAKKPRVVVVENVLALASRGLDTVVDGLEQAGYVVEGRFVAASDVGAPHQRRRVFIVAYTGHVGREGSSARDRSRGRLGIERRRNPDGRGEDVPDADRDDVRHEKQRRSGRRSRRVRDEGRAELGNDGAAAVSGSERGSSAESGLGGNADGLPDRLDRWPGRPGNAPFVWEPRRVTDVYSPTRAVRLHALGNAVVPQCAYVVGLRVREMLGLGAP